MFGLRNVLLDAREGIRTLILRVKHTFSAVISDWRMKNTGCRVPERANLGHPARQYGEVEPGHSSLMHTAFVVGE